MDTEFALEQQIRGEIDDLRQRFPQTQDLYREVCILLFFRYGLTPTANKLYQLVRRGSMSAPAEALSRFWGDLREKSRVRIEHPDLPEELRQGTGELAVSLWTKAQSLAHESLRAFREESQAIILEAQNGQAVAELRQEELARELRVAEEVQARNEQQICSLQDHVAAAAATRVELEERIQQERESQARLQQELDVARVAFEDTRRDLKETEQRLDATMHELEEARQRLTAETDELRKALERAEAKSQAAQKQAAAELDRERAESARLQKDLESAHAAGASAASQHQLTVSILQAQQGDLRQQIGILEGNLQAVTSHREELGKTLETLRGQLAALTAQAGASQAEAELWRSQAQHLEQRLSELARPAQTSTKQTAEEPSKSPSL